MGTKTIRLDEDVYEYIKAKKREDETFSDAVERLTDDWTLLDLVGTYTDEQASRHRKLLEASDEAGIEASRAVLDELGTDGE